MDGIPMKSVLALSLLWGTALTPSQAAVIAIDPSAFGPGSTLINFNGLADGTEVNGLTVGGVSFNYSLGNGSVIIDGGPGDTNNVGPPNVVSTGNNTGVLTLTLGGLYDSFGFGFALLYEGSVLNAATITVFDGATNLGNLAYGAVPDPLFTGGFAGIQSTTPFNRVQLTFNSAVSPAFALDNIRLATTTTTIVPEPSTMMLLAGGLLVLISRRRKPRSLGEHDGSDLPY